MDISPARIAALDLLSGVLHRRRPLDDLLSEGSLDGLEPRERAFARALTATTLRRLGECDALINEWMDRPLPAKATRTRDILRIGLTQVIFMETADHAAVDQTVQMAAASSHSTKHKNLVNALLRRASREAEQLRNNPAAPKLNTPSWLWESWVGAYGEDTATAIATQHLTDPPLDLTVKSGASDWVTRLEGSLLIADTIRRTLTDVRELPGFNEGDWWVQDCAATLPARLLGDVKGRRVADICAAPGGKTMQLAAMGAHVTAIDRSANRLERIRSNLDRTGLTAELVANDAALWQPDQPPDAILLDAPCSATGTIRRHPDVAHLKSPEDVDKLARAQSRLLDAALDKLAPGGKLVYCTCSLQPEEGPTRITALLERRTDATIDPILGSEIGGLDELVTPQGFLRTLPCHLGSQGGMDGFFAARLIKGAPTSSENS